MNITHRTGEKVPESGIYSYQGPADGTTACAPTKEELEIPLSKGETFPPIKSCKTGAEWKKVRDA